MELSHYKDVFLQFTTARALGIYFIMHADIYITVINLTFAVNHINLTTIKLLLSKIRATNSTKKNV